MAKEVDAIRVIEKKPLERFEDWRSYDTLTSFDEVNAEQKPGFNKKYSMDTIETMASNPAPAPALAANLNSGDTQVKEKYYSFSGIIDFAKKAWEWFCSPISIQRDNSGTTGKPAGGSVQPIGGAPALTTPEILIDKEMLEKLIKELQEQAHRIEETQYETEEQLKEDLRKVWQAFLQQMMIREEGVESIKFQLIFDQQKDRKIRKENYTFEVETGEVEKKHQWWSDVNTKLTVASCVVLAALIGTTILSAIPAGAFATAVVGAKLTVTISQVVVSGLKGGSMIMKANLDSDLNRLQGKSFQLKQIHLNISFKMKDDMGHMKAALNQVTKPVENLKDLEKSKHNLVKGILSK